MRLIDADALKAQIQREIDIYFDEDGGGIHTAMEARDEIDNAPTVDAVPVRHGHWIWHKEYKNIYGAKRVECSYCHRHLLVANIAGEHYCKDCGTKMDEEVTEV